MDDVTLVVCDVFQCYLSYNVYHNRCRYGSPLSLVSNDAIISVNTARTTQVLHTCTQPPLTSSKSGFLMLERRTHSPQVVDVTFLESCRYKEDGSLAHFQLI